MSDKESAQNVIDSYRKRQQAAQRAPLLIAIAAILLIAGAGALIFWVLGPNRPAIALFATQTPTPTATSTATSTATQTATTTVTPTEAPSPTITLTPTQSGPFTYTIQEGDTLYDIAQKFNVDLLLLLTINNMDPANAMIQPGQEIIIPGPDTKLPTSTPLPTNLPRGTKIKYRVQFGDSLNSIALQFNSTVEAIKTENKIENENEVFAGEILTIPVNLVTPIPTSTPKPPTATLEPGTVEPTQTATATATATTAP